MSTFRLCPKHSPSRALPDYSVSAGWFLRYTRERPGSAPRISGSIADDTQQPEVENEPVPSGTNYGNIY